jgi:hypothetical protein
MNTAHIFTVVAFVLVCVVCYVLHDKDKLTLKLQELDIELLRLENEILRLEIEARKLKGDILECGVQIQRMEDLL